ncbi:MAG: hypothetical protein CTY16_08140 [Methylobacter sp.]|nr:MAG: hypothetical protein CTY16_08140 [Methylobacter sp.]
MKQTTHANVPLRSWLLAINLLMPLIPYACLPLALLMAPVNESIAGYCDNDNDAPDSDDAAHPQCQPFDPDKNLGGDGPDSCPDSNSGQCKDGQFSGNPINNSIGNKYQTETDYVSSGVYPLRGVRYYNSQSNITNGPFGANWSHAYNARIKKISDTVVQVIRADEKTFTFKLVGGIWTPDGDVNGKLVQLFNVDNVFYAWRYTSGADMVETYGAGGRLSSLKDRAGLTQLLSFDALGHLVKVADSFGNNLIFTYDAQNHINTLSDPAGNIYTYAYDSKNNLVSVTYPDTRKRQYVYENTAFPHALTGIIDEKNVRYATWTYDADGWAVSSSHANGVEAVTLTYDKLNKFTDVKNAIGDNRRYTFRNYLGASHTAHNAPVPTCAAPPCYLLDPINSMTYDSEGNLASLRDVNNQTTSYSYDTARNLETKRTEPAGRTITTEWHPTFRLPTKMVNNGQTTTYSYDNRGNPTSVTISGASTAALGERKWTISYTYATGVTGAIVKKVIAAPSSRMESVPTTIEYYPPDADCGGHSGCRGQIKKITTPRGDNLQFTEYNAHGLLTKLIDINGVNKGWNYDKRMRLTSSYYGLEWTFYGYGNNSLLTKITRPDKSTLAFTYDTAHRLISTQDTLGNKIEYTLDLMGNLTKTEVIDTTGQIVQTHSYTYYTNGRLKTDSGAGTGETTTYTYDDLNGWGNLRSVKDANGLTTAYSYDGLNRLTNTVDPLGNISQQSYDARNNLLSVSDFNGKITSYAYDGLDNLLKEVSPDRGITNYWSYNDDGSLGNKSDNHNYNTSYEYDHLGRLFRADVYGYTTAYNYDIAVNGIGRIASILEWEHEYSGNENITEYSYDKNGRITSQTQTIWGNGTIIGVQTLNRSYKAGGQLVSQTYPSGLEITYSYNLNGDIASINANGSPLLSQIGYYPFGDAESWVWGNGSPYTRNFDNNGRLKNYPLGTGTQSNIYDPAGRIKQYQLNNQVINGFAYDKANHLLAGSSRSYSYDDNGNRVTQNLGANTYTYSINPANNQLTQVKDPNPRNYAFDANGNTTTDGKYTYVWNRKNQLSTSSIGTTTNNYRYNGLKQRIVKSGAGLTNGPYFFVYDPEGHMIGEYDKNNNVRQETIYLGDTPVAVVRPDPVTGLSKTYYIQADHLDAPRVILNTANVPVWRWDNADPFGKILPLQDPDGDGKTFEYNLRFPGQYYDKETGLHYNHNRYYDPLTGRYLSYDPIGLAGGVNPYTYVGGNPVNWVDPLGLTQRDIDTARQLAIETQPDMKFPEQYGSRDLGNTEDGRRITGLTLPPDNSGKGGGTILDDIYQKDLSNKQAVELLDTIIHEADHYSNKRGDPKQNDDNGTGHAYDEATRRTTKKLIEEFNKRRKIKKCP